MGSLILSILNLIGLKKLWQYIKSIGYWLKPTGISQNNKPLYFKVGESAYRATLPFVDESEVYTIIGQIMIGNPNKKERIIISFRLEYEDKEPYLVSEARSGNSSFYLAPSGGGASSVPSKTYLNIPIKIPANDGIVGWIGFTIIERRDLKLNDVWNKQARLVAIQSDGKELYTSFPKCDLPRAE